MRGSLYRSTFVAALGGLLFGFDTAVIAGAIGDISEVYALSNNMKGFTTASALIGTVLGALFAGKPGTAFGRRDSLVVLAALFFISALGCALAWDVWSLIVFRFIGGLGVGGASVLGPMYIAEIAPASMRGRLVMLFQFSVVFGILAAYCSNFLVGLAVSEALEWRVKLGVETVPAMVFMALLLFIPRSPRWLMQQSRRDEALHVLTLIGEPDPQAELNDIARSLDAEHGHARESLYQPKYKFPTFLAVSIAMFNQLAGINALLYYLNDVFAAAGFSEVSGDIQAVAIGATNLVFTMAAMVFIDRFGRKFLLMLGSVGTAAALAGVSYIFFSGAYQQYLVVLLVIYIAFFGFSQGAVIWVYIGEVFPNRVRADGQALGSFTHWIMNAIITWTFPIIAAESGGYPFALFSVMMVVQFFVVWRLYPETKGVSLEAMQDELGIAD